MQPRFLGQLGVADLVTAANAAIGFVAVAVAAADPELAARLILLAAIADGLDGVVARYRGEPTSGRFSIRSPTWRRSAWLRPRWCTFSPPTAAWPASGRFRPP